MCCEFYGLEPRSRQQQLGVVYKAIIWNSNTCGRQVAGAFCAAFGNPSTYYVILTSTRLRGAVLAFGSGGENLLHGLRYKEITLDSLFFKVIQLHLPCALSALSASIHLL